MELVRTTPQDEGFQNLVVLLDKEHKARDSDQHAFHSDHNKTDHQTMVVVARQDGKAVGCGALKSFSDGVLEVKRMFVLKEFRQKGIAVKVLHELESWAIELSALRCILETGKNQSEAIAFYHKNGYSQIDNFGPFKGVENSICFEKVFVGG